MLSSDELAGIRMVHEELTARVQARADGAPATVEEVEGDLEMSMRQVADLLADATARGGA